MFAEPAPLADCPGALRWATITRNETGVRWKWIPFVVLGFVLLSWIVFEARDLLHLLFVVTWVRGIDPVWAAVAIFALLVAAHSCRCPAAFHQGGWRERH